MQDEFSKHLLIMECDDVNDKDLDILLEVLKKNLKDFQICYADGNYINLRWN